VQGRLQPFWAYLQELGVKVRYYNGILFWIHLAS
jgi:hypothetical protein